MTGPSTQALMNTSPQVLRRIAQSRAGVDIAPAVRRDMHTRIPALRIERIVEQARYRAAVQLTQRQHAQTREGSAWRSGD